MDTYKKLEDFGDFEQWEKISDDRLTSAKMGVEKGSSISKAFEAQENGFIGQIWKDNN